MSWVRLIITMREKVCVKYLYCIAPYLFYHFEFLPKSDVSSFMTVKIGIFMSPYRGMPIAVLDQVDFFVTIDTKHI